MILRHDAITNVCAYVANGGLAIVLRVVLLGESMAAVW